MRFEVGVNVDGWGGRALMRMAMERMASAAMAVMLGAVWAILRSARHSAEWSGSWFV